MWDYIQQRQIHVALEVKGRSQVVIVDVPGISGSVLQFLLLSEDNRVT